MAIGLVSRLLRALDGRQREDDPATPDEPPRPGPSTGAFRQILSAAKAMKYHHGVDRTAGDYFHLNLGHVLALRYHEEGRTDPEYGVLAQALRLYCSPVAVRQFHAQASGLGKPIPFSIDADGGFHDAPGSQIVPVIDFHGVAADQARTGGMTRESGPFIGAAGELWDAGMDGVPEDDPAVIRPREDVRRLLSGDDGHRLLHLQA